MIDNPVLLAVFVVLSAIFLPLAIRKGLFSLPKRAFSRGSISLGNLLIAFTLVFVITLVLPFVLKKCFAMMGLSDFLVVTLPPLLTYPILAIVLLAFSVFASQEIKKRIWGEKKCTWFLFVKKVGAVLLCYPLVIVFSQCIHIIVHLFGSFPEADQLAISQLKAFGDTPWLFWSYGFVIIGIVPIIEELAFRGFLQNYLVDLIGARAGVLIGSVIFALFHYFPGQGMTNIELLGGLFVISYFIGSSYVREGSLLIPIGMHAVFNALSLLFFILFTK